MAWPTPSYTVLGMSENVLRSSETSLKYLPAETSHHPGRLSLNNTADRTSNFVVSTLKIVIQFHRNVGIYQLTSPTILED